MKITTEKFGPCIVRDAWKEDGRQITMAVEFGLHKLAGNRSPYFSITADGRENGLESFGGCCHEIIAERLPELSDVIALHLSDLDGVPMHAEANGAYFLAGGMWMFQRKESGDWRAIELRNGRTLADIIADHFRISLDRAQALHKKYLQTADNLRPQFMAEIMAERLPVWHAEALAVIKKYQLGVYGDNPKTHAETLAMFNATQTN